MLIVGCTLSEGVYERQLVSSSSSECGNFEGSFPAPGSLEGLFEPIQIVSGAEGEAMLVSDPRHEAPLRYTRDGFGWTTSTDSTIELDSGGVTILEESRIDPSSASGFRWRADLLYSDGISELVPPDQCRAEFVGTALLVD